MRRTLLSTERKLREPICKGAITDNADHAHDPIRRRVAVRGIVQGVGFRPAMHRSASALGLVGMVGNDGTGVFVEIEGARETVDAFIDGLRDAAPPLAVIDDVLVEEVDLTGGHGFAIVESDASTAKTTLLTPDVAPCVDCLRELADPADRRHRYPFLNCTNCGPRYSIVRSLPYDRASTTMSGFTMCHACASEYHDIHDRRFHAQPTCCPRCGPSLSLRSPDGRSILVDDVVAATVEHLRRGAIVAVKGLGGFHLAVDAADEDAVARLRDRKHREEKPFALLVADVAAAREIAMVTTVEADLLVDPSRPVVLLPRRDDAGARAIARSVAPGNRSRGVLLPPTPLHVLLAEEFGAPLVLTSGNRSDRPIVVDDDVAIEQLGSIADVFCTHDRPIHVRIDDSVTRVVDDRQIVVRRARGLTPRPIRIDAGFPRHTLACGAQLKATVCLGRDDVAFVSQHLGDLSDYDTVMAYEQAVGHLGSLFGIEPVVVAHDLHPDMASTTYALRIAETADAGCETVGVQHHHAHIASCLADNAREDDVIGIAFDGLGLGADGSIWGGEVLHANLTDFRRLGHLRTVPLPGGDAAIREPWRLAAMHLATVLDVDAIEALDVFARNRAQWPAVRAMAAGSVNTPPTSSAGRLFDAVASIVGIRDRVSYEGQAAIELEQRAATDHRDSYPFLLSDGEPFVIDTAPLIGAIASDLSGGVSVERIAARFHNAVVDLIVASARRSRRETGLATVALSGGVFQNAMLVSRAAVALRALGFDVLVHRRVPPNDGGISLGQAVIVAARDRR